MKDPIEITVELKNSGSANWPHEFLFVNARDRYEETFADANQDIFSNFVVPKRDTHCCS
jgi:hypothetical protein